MPDVSTGTPVTKVDGSNTEGDAHAQGVGAIDFEREAAKMGWRPKDAYKGDPARWVDAEQYYNNGQIVLPIIKAENASLRSELVRVKEQANAFVEVADRANARELADLKAQLVQAKVDRKEAVRTGDGEAFEVAEEQVKVLEAATTAPAKKAPQQVPLDPIFVQWKAENPWFDADPVKQARAVAIGNGRPDLHGKGREFYDYVSKEIAAMDAYEASRDGTTRPGPQRGGSSRNTSQAPAKRSYQNLLPEYQQKCESMYRDFGAKGTKENWQTRYVNGCADDAFKS